MSGKLILASLLAFSIFGCDAGSTRNSTYEEVPAEKQGGNTNTIQAGGDVTMNETVVTDDGVYIYNSGDGDVTYVHVEDEGQYYQYASDSSTATGTGAEVSGMSEKTCKENNYFWCTLSNTCIDNGGQGGTGSCTAVGN